MKGDISIRQELKKYAPLLLLPLLFSIVLYFFIQNFTLRHMQESAEQTLDHFYTQISAMTRETDSTARSLNSDFSLLANLPEGSALPYSYDDPFSLCRQIDIRKGDSPYIDHIYFVSETDDAIYSDSGYYTRSSLPGILSGLSMREEEFNLIDEPLWNMSAVGFLKEPFYVIPFRNSSGEIAGRLLFTISLDTFVDNISSLDVAFACLYSEDFLIASRPLSRSFSSADLSSESSVGELLGERVKCFYFESGDYTYLVARSVRDYYTPLRLVILGFVLYAVLVFWISFFYLLRVSKARYASLKALVDALPQESGEVSPAYQELVPAVQSALMNVSDLRERQQELSREHVIHNILHRYTKFALLQKYAQELGIPTSGVSYTLALFSIRKWDSIALATSSPEDSHQMAWTIFKTAAAQFASDGVQILCDNDTEAFNALFCGDFQTRPTFVETTCEDICRFMHDEYGIELHASVSNPTQALSEIPNLLSQAQRLESFSQSINSASSVISEGLLKGSSGSFITGNFFRQEVTLATTLLAKKYDVVPSMVASILDEHVTNNPDYDVAMSRLKAVSGTLAEALLTVKGVDLDLPFYARRLREINTVSELNADVEFVFLELDRAVNAAPTTFKEVIDACGYIKENLDDKNLNVTMISEAVGTIPQRLIPMFQKQLNMGIAEYVNAQRIERATKLLTTTKLKVTQISDLVGYCNTDTFTRNFRKLMGSTPTEYRQMTV